MKGRVGSLVVSGYGFGSLVWIPLQTAFVNPHNINIIIFRMKGRVGSLVVSGYGFGSLVWIPLQTAFVNPHNIKVKSIIITRRPKDQNKTAPSIYAI